MNIAVIGAGRVGSALAAGWVRAGHSVTLGVRDPESTKTRQAEAQTGAAAGTVEAAVRDAEAVLIATPPTAARAVADALGRTPGAVLIDATNAVRTRPEPFATVAEALKAWTGAEHVVKCFNTTGFENMADPHYGDTAADMFMAGDSAHGKTVAARLARDLGFAACHDCGGDDRFALLEQLALNWINLAIFQGRGRNIAFKLIER